MKYDVLIYKNDASCLFIAEVPDLPGCMSQGRTFEEAQENIHEAIEGHVAALRDLGKGVPSPSHYTLVSVQVGVA